MTNESKFTPGPWRASIGGAGCNVSVNSTMQAPIVVPINPNWLLTHPELVEEAQANAALIAQAPTLLRQRDEAVASLREFVQASNELAVAITPEQIAESTVKLTGLCHQARSILNRMESDGNK